MADQFELLVHIVVLYACGHLRLGEQVFNYVLLNKRKEWEAYRGQVTPLELKNNLELL